MYTFEDAERIYNTDFDKDHLLSQFIAVSLYMRDELGLKSKAREDRLYELIYERIPDFNRNVQWRIVRSALNKAKNKNNCLFHKSPPKIYDCEMEYLKGLDISDELKQILFTLLVKYKFSKDICDAKGIEKNGYNVNVKNSLNTLRHQANISRTNDCFCNMIQQLIDLGYITSVSLVFIICNFIENIDYTNCKEIDTVEDLGNIGFKYLHLIGDKRIKVCKACGCLICSSAKHTLYCSKCKKEVEKERDLAKHKRFYEKHKKCSK